MHDHTEKDAPRVVSPRPRVTYDLPPRVDDTIAYQRYFLMALEQVASVEISGETLMTWPYRGVDAKIAAAFRSALWRGRARLPFLRANRESGIVGRYTADIDGTEVRFAIDGHDGREVFDPAALGWADLYFKANHWPSFAYEAKVRPLINGNGGLDRTGIARLAQLRDREKTIDLTFISNIWGGREHGVRLFEELARVEGRTELHAIFPAGFDEPETASFKARLRTAGVRAADSRVPLHELWDTLAHSKIVFFRAGKHLCLPWRTLDLLAMGACIVFDSRPYPEWYVPLRPEVNFVDCGLGRPVNTSPAPAHEYARIAPTIAKLLADVAKMASIRQNNAAYFDEVAAPERIGAHIIHQLQPTQVTCRAVQPQDAKPLARLFEALADSGDGAHFHPHPLDEAAATTVCSYQGSDVYCIAESNGAVVGYGLLRGWDEGYEVPSLGIAVHPDHRSQGIGKALMIFLHAAARDRGARTVRLKVYPDNGPGLRLYRGLGYTFSGEEDGQAVGTVRL